MARKPSPSRKETSKKRWQRNGRQHYPIKVTTQLGLEEKLEADGKLKGVWGGGGGGGGGGCVGGESLIRYEAGRINHFWKNNGGRKRGHMREDSEKKAIKRRGE